MDTPASIYLDQLEQAKIQADAYTGAFEDHRASMDPASIADRIREKKLHATATICARYVEVLEAKAAKAKAS